METIDLPIKKESSVKDYILIAQIEKGNETAFNILFDRYYLKVLNTLKRNNTIFVSDHAHDYVIDAFIDFRDQVMQGRYKEQGRVFNYIYTIAHRIYLRAIGKNKEDVTEEDRLNSLREEIFDNNDEMELYFNIIEEVIAGVTLGKSDKKIDCAELLYAQYGIVKTSDADLYEEFPEKFTGVEDVKKKRWKCIQKIKKEALKLL